MKQKYPENPVNPVKNKNLSDRIYRIDRMFSPFPDEKEKEPNLRQIPKKSHKSSSSSHLRGSIKVTARSAPR
jgi:hypothetical protein